MNCYEDTDYADRWEANEEEWEREDDEKAARESEVREAIKRVDGLTFCLNTLLLVLADTPRSPLPAASCAYDILFRDYLMSGHRNDLSVEDAITLHNCAAARTFNDGWKPAPYLLERAIVQSVIDATVARCKADYLTEG